MANTLISKTFSSAGNRKTWTWSAWIKIIANTSYTYTLMTQVDGWSGNSNGGFYLNGESLETYNLLSNVNSGISSRVSTNAMLRDPNGWYHVVLRFDTTQSTASDRVRWYINGELQTSLKYANYPSQNFDANFNTAAAHGIGRHTNSSTYPYEGSMSHIHFCDGYSYAPTEFGETDSTTGEWKIKTSPSVSYGTNGFFILKDGNSVTDQSGNSNNWTVASGTLTNTEDCPSNVFATLNPLDIGYTSNLSLANGNNTTNQTSNWGDYGIRSTLAATTGKYYWEAKIATSNTLCIIPMETRLVINLSDGSPADDLYGVQRYSDSTSNIYDDGTFVQNTSAMWGGITSSDIISFALDLDNGKLFLAKNGAYKNQSGATGDPVNGTNPTFTISDTTKTYGFYTEMRGNDNNGTIMNFGNGYFGTTAVSSAGTNASGNGIFEYDVPTGFTALSTKGLNL